MTRLASAVDDFDSTDAVSSSVDVKVLQKKKLVELDGQPLEVVVRFAQVLMSRAGRGSKAAGLNSAARGLSAGAQAEAAAVAVDDERVLSTLTVADQKLLLELRRACHGLLRDGLETAPGSPTLSKSHAAAAAPGPSVSASAPGTTVTVPGTATVVGGDGGTVTPSGGSGAQNFNDQWSDFIAKGALTGGHLDVNALVQFVLRESYLETTEDLRFYAEKVRFYNDLKKVIRDELTRAREFQSEMAPLYDNSEEDPAIPGYFETKNFYEVPQMVDGKPQVRDPSTGDALTLKSQLESYIEEMEEKLSAVGDDAQLANVDLQNMLQKQQQTMQMMSNISKMLHDTSLAIIRKIGG